MSRFSERLSALGFSSYEEYLRSPHWKEFQAQYRSSGRPKRCAVCRGRPVQLHHHTYERIGLEGIEDVTPLCREHHQSVHAWLRDRRKMVNATHIAVKALRGDSAPKEIAHKGKKPKAKKNREPIPPGEIPIMSRKALKKERAMRKGERAATAKEALRDKRRQKIFEEYEQRKKSGTLPSSKIRPQQASRPQQKLKDYIRSRIKSPESSDT